MQQGLRVIEDVNGWFRIQRFRSTRNTLNVDIWETVTGNLNEEQALELFNLYRKDMILEPTKIIAWHNQEY